MRKVEDREALNLPKVIKENTNYDPGSLTTLLYIRSQQSMAGGLNMAH